MGRAEAIPIMFWTTAMGFAKGSTHPTILLETVIASSAKQSIVSLRCDMDCFVASAFARRRASADKSAPLRKRFAFVAGNDDLPAV
jgi:hypothetical protein